MVGKVVERNNGGKLEKKHCGKIEREKMAAKFKEKKNGGKLKRG